MERIVERVKSERQNVKLVLLVQVSPTTGMRLSRAFHADQVNILMPNLKHAYRAKQDIFASKEQLLPVQIILPNSDKFVKLVSTVQKEQLLESLVQLAHSQMRRAMDNSTSANHAQQILMEILLAKLSAQLVKVILFQKLALQLVGVLV